MPFLHSNITLQNHCAFIFFVNEFVIFKELIGSIFRVLQIEIRNKILKSMHLSINP